MEYPKEIKLKITDPELIKMLCDQAQKEHRTKSNMATHILHLHKEAIDLLYTDDNYLEQVG